MWKTFRDFLWPHSNLQIKVMWAPVAGCCLATVTGSLSSGLHVFPARKSAWVPFTFDSLVYRSFSWNLIWQHPAFYKLTERRHFFKKKKMWLNLLERGIIYYYRKTRCVDKPTRLSATRGGILWNTHTVKPRKFAECVLRRAERKLSMRLLFALVPKSFFPEEQNVPRMWQHMSPISGDAVGETQFCCVPGLQCLPEPAFPQGQF